MMAKDHAQLRQIAHPLVQLCQEEVPWSVFQLPKAPEPQFKLLKVGYIGEYYRGVLLGLLRGMRGV